MSQFTTQSGFDSKQIQRYSRQIILPQIGASGQKKLAEAKVLVVGAGGLGCPVSLYLTAAGVGEIGLIDPDKVELSNLHRQILHGTADIGKAKIDSARQKLSEINGNTLIKTYHEELNSRNFRRIAQNYDLIADGTDNFRTKFAVNDLCQKEEKKLVLAGVFKFDAQIMTVVPKKTACYRCVYKTEPDALGIPDCSEAGVLGSVVGIVGCIQATEIIKLIIDSPDVRLNQLILFNALDLTINKFAIKQVPGCVCSPE